MAATSARGSAASATPRTRTGSTPTSTTRASTGASERRGAIDQIDHRLAQDLVDRFVQAGAQVIFVGPSTHLHGPAGIIQVLLHHDDHLHIRLPAP